MTLTLFRKEFRALRPYWVLAILLMVLSASEVIFTLPGPRSLASNFPSLAGSTLSFLYAMVALALGTGISVKERDEGTLGFLDSLPVTRTRVFLVKLAAAMLVLVALPVFQILWAVFEHALARGSLDWPFRWNLLLGSLLMQTQLMATFLAAGTLLGFARSLTWMLVGVVAIAIQRLVHLVPRAAALDPFRLIESGIEGVRWRYDVEAILVQGVVALVCVSLSLVFFVRAGRSRTVLVNPRPVVGAIVTVITLGVLFIAVYLWQGTSGPREPDGEPDLEAIPSSAPASTTTKHYEFSYPSIESQPALALAEKGDETYERVSQLLGADGGAPILVDLSGTVRNTVGTAFRDRIRMRADDEAVATLAHETGHVIARRIVGEEGFRRWSHARVLDEGLASWIEGHFLEHPVAEQQVLAALLDRDELKLGEIIEFEAFARNGDEDLKYVIGRGLIDAMVKRYGPDSIHRLLAAFGAEQLPPKLSGATLWQTAFQLAGMDLSLVADDFFARVDERLALERAEIDALPRPEARLVTKDDWYGVEVRLPDEGDSRRLTVRFRPAPDSSPDQYDRVVVKNGEVAWRNAERIQRQRICFQAGVQLAPKATLFEQWTCLPLSSAAPWEAAAEEPEALDLVEDAGVE